jgi:hypothetical protein
MLHNMSLRYRLSRMSDSELDRFRMGLLAEVHGVVSAMGQEQEQEQQHQQGTQLLAQTLSSLHLEQDNTTLPSLSGGSQHQAVVDIE